MKVCRTENCGSLAALTDGRTDGGGARGSHAFFHFRQGKAATEIEIVTSRDPSPNYIIVARMRGLRFAIGAASTTRYCPFRTVNRNPKTSVAVAAEDRPSD